MAIKKKWVGPQLIVLVRGGITENVLDWCKNDAGGWWSNGGCVYHDHSDCFASSSQSDS